MKSPSECPVHTLTCYFNCNIKNVPTVYTKNTILFQYWPTVCDAGPGSKHWMKVFLIWNLEIKDRVGLHIGEPSLTSCFHSSNEWRITRQVHHWTNIGAYYRPTAVQAKRQYLLTSQVSRYCLLHLKRGTVIQKIVDKSGRPCWMT